MSGTRIRLGISSCLVGEKVRYDGNHKLDPYLRDTLGRFVEWVPVCPEVGCGLGVPREAMRLVGDPAAPRLVTRAGGVDHTARMQAWAAERLEGLAADGLRGFVFKSKSPSSGLTGVRVYGAGGAVSRAGSGIFARAFTERFPLVPVEDEGRLNDPDLRENFVERVFVYDRWRALLERGGAPGDLVAFHTEHKLQLLAHSPRHYAELGRIVAGAGAARGARGPLLERYGALLMEGLRLVATVRKNTNVLQHVAGYFRGPLPAAERRELLDLIERYRLGQVPLIVPVVLINHHVARLGVAYLRGQRFLNPHPMELMLRNHV